MTEIFSFLKEFDAILGTILGSVATLIVTEIIRHLGKIKCYVNQFSKTPIYHNQKDGTIIYQKEEQTELEAYAINFQLDIYNSSELPKIMRNLKLRIEDGKKNYEEITVTDESTRKIDSFGISHVCNLDVLNVLPKKVISLNLGAYFEFKTITLPRLLTLKLVYKDENNHEKIINIRKEEFED